MVTREYIFILSGILSLIFFVLRPTNDFSKNTVQSLSFEKQLLETQAISGCSGTLINTFASNDNEGGRILLSIPSGFLIGGTKGDSTLIVHLDVDANLIWSRTFKFSTYTSEGPSDMIIDSEGNMLGVGWGTGGGSKENYIFKYDFLSDNVLWSMVLNGPSNSSFRKVLEKASGDNYFVLGQTGSNSSPGSGCDALFMEVNRNTGAKMVERNFSLGSCEAFTQSVIYNGAIYTTGVLNSSNGFDGLRASIIKLDFSGNVSWSRSYLRNTTNTGRLYGSNILIEDNSIFVVGRGDMNGTSGTSIEVHLFKTDISGNIAWAKEYNILGASGEKPSEIVSLPDGFLIKGYYTNSLSNFTFLMKVDKQGVLEWSKTFEDVGGTDYVNDLVVVNSDIYFVGYYNNNAGNDDLLFVKLDSDINILPACPIMSNLSMTESDLINPFDGTVNLSEFSNPLALNANPSVSTFTNLVENNLCFYAMSIHVDLTVEPLCANACNGVAAATITGGTPPFTYLWSNGETGNLATALCEGTNTVTVTDLQGYECIETIEVPTISPLSLTLGSTAPTASGNDGTASVNAAGGAQPYIYQWSNGQFGQTLTGLIAGNYMVTVTDANGCESIENIEVEMYINTANLDNLINFKLFPNPSNGQFVVQLDFSGFEKADILVHNTIGQNILRFHKEGRSIEVPINITRQPAGTYWVTIQTDKGTATKPLILNK